MAVESAIPAHLVQERIQPLRGSKDFEPPVEAFTSRFPKHVKDIVMVILGVQHTSQALASTSKEISKLITFVKDVDAEYRPQYWELAASSDPTGAYNQVLIAYWPSKSAYAQWYSKSGLEVWWESSSREADANGWFKEIFLPSADRFETIFSGPDSIEGVAYMQEKMSGPVREHVYWGSMRDRLPAAQTNDLAGTTSSTDSRNLSSSKRVRVPGRQNLAVIRSGQDWSHMTKPDERKQYLEDVHPVLIKGMDFLTTKGEEIGCISNRFMQVLDVETLRGDETRKTFGLGYFTDLGALEAWSKSHRTHLNIFGQFMKYAAERQGDVALRLFHEVLVLESAQQEFEYIGCHKSTGMLAGLHA